MLESTDKKDCFGIENAAANEPGISNENVTKNITSLSNETLLGQTKFLFDREKQISDRILLYLAEINRRRLYLELGFESLYKFLIGHFRLGESSAYNRIKAMRLTEEVPAAKQALTQNSMNLSTLTQAQVFFQSVEKTEGKLSIEKKTEVIEKLRDKSQVEVKQILVSINPKAAEPKKESLKPLSAESAKLTVVISKQLVEKLEKIKNYNSHKNHNPTYEELFDQMADFYLKAIEKRKYGSQSKISHKPDKSPANESAKSLPGKGKSYKNDNEISAWGAKTGSNTKPCVRTTRQIPIEIQRRIWTRSMGQCEYISKEGNRCQSRYQLELHHERPFSVTGKHDSIKLLCHEHHKHETRKIFGDCQKKLNPFRNSGFRISLGL